MSTNWSTARRRLSLAFVPAALASLAFAGSAFAGGSEPTCVLPAEVVAYGNPPTTLPTCLPNLVLDKVGPPAVGPGKVTWKIIVWHGGYPGAADPFESQVGIPISKITVNDPTLGLTDLTPDSVPKDEMLYPGRAITYTVTQRLDSKVCDKKDVSNTAEMTVGVPQTRTDDDSDTAVAKVDCTADLAVVKATDKDTYAPGETVKWTVTVTNTGGLEVPVGRIKVDDPGVTLVPAESNPTGVLKPGEKLVYTVDTPVTVANCGPVSNTATVSLTGQGPIDANADNNASRATVTVAGEACSPPPPKPTEQPPGNTSVTPPGPGSTSGTPTAVCPRVSVSVGINAPKRPFAGQISTVTLTVKARNDAKKVKLTYRVPSSFTVTARSGGAKLRNGLLTADLGSISAGRTKQVRLSVSITRTAQGRRQHTATVSATCAATARAALASNVRPLQGAVQPAVTG